METDEYLNKKIYIDLLSRKGSLKAGTFSEFLSGRSKIGQMMMTTRINTLLVTLQ